MSYLGITNRDVARLIRDKVRSGEWTADKSNGGHIRLRHASGALYFTATTPGDHRAVLNLRNGLTKIERAAAIIPQTKEPHDAR